MRQRECGVIVRWSNGDESKCHVLIDEDQSECYAHSKYFNRVTIADGEEIWQMTPAPEMLRKPFQANGNALYGETKYITSLYSPHRDMGRSLREENDNARVSMYVG